MQSPNLGIAWDDSRSKRIAILLVAVAMAVLLVVSFLPNAQAADSLELADGDTAVVAWGYPTGSGGYPIYPSGSYSMRGVSWS